MYNKLIFECPPNWLDGDFLDFQHRRVFAQIEAAAAALRLPLERRIVPRGADFAPRHAADDALLISTHSVGFRSNILRLKEFYIPGFYTLDRFGYSGWAEIAHNPVLQTRACAFDAAAFAGRLDEVRGLLATHNQSKYHQPAAGGFSAPTKTGLEVFVAMQTAEDAVAVLADVPQLALLRWVAEACTARGIRLWVKRHPKCDNPNVAAAIRSVELSSAGLVRCVQASIHDLIQRADLTITVNSGVGFEALLAGRHVATAGKSDYALVTSRIASLADIHALLDQPRPANPSLVERYLAFHLFDYSVHLDDGSVAKRIQRAAARRWPEHDTSDEAINSLCAVMQANALALQDIKTKALRGEFVSEKTTSELTQTLMQRLTRVYRRAL